jgi:hypothetical protein
VHILLRKGVNLDPSGSGMTIFGYDFGQQFLIQLDPNSQPDSKFYEITNDVDAGPFSTKNISFEERKLVAVHKIEQLETRQDEKYIMYKIFTGFE